jgi:hypothetical protein
MELKVCTKIVVKVDTLETLKLTVIGSILLTKMVQWKILQLWDDYANNKITASHLLKKCGSLYTPGV